MPPIYSRAASRRSAQALSLNHPDATLETAADGGHVFDVFHITAFSVRISCSNQKCYAHATIIHEE